MIIELPWLENLGTGLKKNIFKNDLPQHWFKYKIWMRCPFLCAAVFEIWMLRRSIGNIESYYIDFIWEGEEIRRRRLIMHLELHTEGVYSPCKRKRASAVFAEYISFVQMTTFQCSLKDLKLGKSNCGPHLLGQIPLAVFLFTTSSGSTTLYLRQSLNKIRSLQLHIASRDCLILR